MGKNSIGISWALGAYELMEDLGFDFMDVFGYDLTALSDGEFDCLAAKVQSGAMPCANICLYCGANLQFMGPAFDPAAVEEYAVKAVRRAKALGMGGIGIGSGASRTVPAGFPVERAEAQLMESLRVTAAEAAKAGMAVMLEPLNHMCCNHLLTTGEVARFIDRAEIENLSMVFDLHHSAIMGENLQEFGPWVPYMRSVQFNEVDFKTGVKLFLREENFEYYYRQLATLRALGYTGDFCVEPIATENLAEEARRTRDIVERLKEKLD